MGKFFKYAGIKYLGYGNEGIAYTDGKVVAKQIFLPSGISNEKFLNIYNEFKKTVYPADGMTVLFPEYKEYNGNLFSVTPLIKGKSLKDISKNENRMRELTHRLVHTEKPIHMDRNYTNLFVDKGELFHIDPITISRLLPKEYENTANVSRIIKSQLKNVDVNKTNGTFLPLLKNLVLSNEAKGYDKYGNRLPGDVNVLYERILRKALIGKAKQSTINFLRNLKQVGKIF